MAMLTALCMLLMLASSVRCYCSGTCLSLDLAQVPYVGQLAKLTAVGFKDLSMESLLLLCTDGPACFH